MFSRFITFSAKIQTGKIKIDPLRYATGTQLLLSQLETCQKSSVTCFTSGRPDRFVPVRILHTETRPTSTFSITKMANQIGTNTMNILLGVDLNELRKAPVSAFWITTGGGAMFLTPPVLEILLGYSPLLTSLEKGIGVAFLAMLGTMKWGHCLERAGKDGPTWFNLTWSMIPPGFALFCYMLPEGPACLMLAAGIGHALFMDVTKYTYPPWANALGCYISTIAIISLVLTATGHLLFA